MDDEIVFKADTLASSKHKVIAKATKRDDQLLMLKKVICDGWPDKRADAPLDVLQFLGLPR